MEGEIKSKESEIPLALADGTNNGEQLTESEVIIDVGSIQIQIVSE